MALVESLDYLRGEISKAVDDFTAWKARLFIAHKQGGEDIDVRWWDIKCRSVLMTHSVLLEVCALEERRLTHYIFPWAQMPEADM